MKGKFDLQNALFQSDTEQQDVRMPKSELINLYSSEYSLVLNQAKQFFTQCKESLVRFISLNQYGIGFNLPLIWTSIIKMQNQTCQNSGLSNDNRFKDWGKKKPKYEGMFHNILQKMNEVIGDLLQIQRQIKEAYLNNNVHSPSKNLKTDRTMKKQSSRISGRSSEKSINLRKILLKEQMDDILDYEDETMKNKLSEKLLQINSDRFIANDTKVCHQDKSLQNNIQKLDQKMLHILQMAQECKNKQKQSFQTYQKKKQLLFINSEDNVNGFADNQKDIDVVTIRNLSNKLAHQRINSRQLNFANQ